MYGMKIGIDSAALAPSLRIIIDAGADADARAGGLNRIVGLLQRLARDDAVDV